MRVFYFTILFPALLLNNCITKNVNTLNIPQSYVQPLPVYITDNYLTIGFRINITNNILELWDNTPTKIDLFEVIFKNEKKDCIDTGELYLDQIQFLKFNVSENNNITYRILDKGEKLFYYNNIYTIYNRGKDFIPAFSVKIKTPSIPLRLISPKYSDIISKSENLDIRWSIDKGFPDKKIELVLFKGSSGI